MFSDSLHHIRKQVPLEQLTSRDLQKGTKESDFFRFHIRLINFTRTKRHGEIVGDVKMGKRYDNFDKMLDELLEEDPTALSKLLNTTRCSDEGECAASQSRSCSCVRCALCVATDIHTYHSPMYANEIKILYPLPNTDSLIDLVREMVAHGIVEYDKIITRPDDVLTKVLEFVEYRFPDAQGAVNA
jgi:hypothetical protein